MKNAAIELVRWMAVHPAVAIGVWLFGGVWIVLARLGLIELEKTARKELEDINRIFHRWEYRFAYAGLIAVLIAQAIAFLLYWLLLVVLFASAAWMIVCGFSS